ncbi:Trp biosynthesis-associated membrane protein [Granulicoccus sp. GXG6511]|uniref:Trp biosynthesis-associated membrane protein n=1 Tax=Granulicoccus sp. GXG6511 TaxID=3381351 RepID=UPI003D7DB93B
MSDRVRNSARERGAAFGLLALASLVGLLLATQNWWTHPAVTTGTTGNDATASLAGVLAGAAAAGTGLAALSGRRARTVLGVLLVALGIGMVVVAATAGVSAVDLTSGPGFVPGNEELAPTGLRWFYLACGVLVVGGASVLSARAGRWPARRDRYARIAARSTTTAEDDAADVWKAMDAGFDPTEIRGPEGDPSGRKRSDQGE